MTTTEDSTFREDAAKIQNALWHVKLAGRVEVGPATAALDRILTSYESMKAENERLNDAERWTAEERKRFLYGATKASYAEGTRAGCEELSMAAAEMSIELEEALAQLESIKRERDEARASEGNLHDRIGIYRDDILTLEARLTRCEEALSGLIAAILDVCSQSRDERVLRLGDRALHLRDQLRALSEGSSEGKEGSDAT